MERSQDQFRGVIPRLSPRLLPPMAGQNAVNARLQSGDIEPWRQFHAEHVLALSAPIDTIYKLNGAWLEWASDVDVARGPVPGDTTFRAFITGPAAYSTPVWTDYTKATAGSEPYPVLVRPLGVIAPTDGPQYIDTTLVSGFDQTEETDYVHTYVNDIGEESAPGSTMVQLVPNIIPFAPTGNGDYNRVALYYSASSGHDDYHVTTVRLYRAATGATGTAFRFVVEIPLSSFTNLGAGHYDYIYSDSLPDTALGEVLESTDWDLPPADMKGIIALPNGVMAGFSKNRLCLSAQNHPHAWPVAYQLNTDTSIIAIENVDTAIVVMTRSFPYIAIGTDPAQYSMTKFEFAHACVSKRSIAAMQGIGVVAATAYDLVAVQGVGQVVSLTRDLFTRQQWTALAPSSMLGAVHNNNYYFFYDTGSVKGGYVLDMSPGGMGLVPLSFHATAAYTDPETGHLYLVLDTMNEPVDANLLLPSTAPTPDGKTIYDFDSPSGIGNVVYKYRGRLCLLERPAAFNFAQLKAGDFTNIVLNIYADGVKIFGQAITAQTEFTLPMTDEYVTVEWELIGTSRVRSIQLAEAVDELRLVPQTVTAGPG